MHLVLLAQRPKLLGYQFGGFELAESGFGILQDGLGDGYEIFGFGVDNLRC